MYGMKAMAKDKLVLVVDDEQDIQALMASALGMEGYWVQTASNGREALEAVERRMPDLIPLDMNMPVMDGWGFVREFQARYGWQVPIVVFTAGDAKKCAHEIGAAGWVAKPFRLDSLVCTVERCIR